MPLKKEAYSGNSKSRQLTRETLALERCSTNLNLNLESILKKRVDDSQEQELW